VSNDEVGIFGGRLQIDRPPASGEMLVGNGTDFTLTQSNVTFGNPVVVNVPLTVNGQVWSEAGGFKFPDNSVQTSAATSYIPPSVATGTIESNISGSSAAPSANTISSVLDNLFGTTQGTVVYRGASSWSALTPGTPGQYLQTQGASANPQWATVQQTWTTVFRTTDNSVISNATLANDGQLQFTMAANTKYRIRASISLLNGSGGGAQIGFVGPASPSVVSYNCISNVGGTSSVISSFFINPYYSTTAYPASPLAWSGSGTSFWLTYDIYVSNGPSSGTFAFQFAQNTSSATASVLRAGSYLDYAIVQ
jgi:hypothetical protein